MVSGTGQTACGVCRDVHAPGATTCPQHLVGKVIAGRYRLVKVLGVGGMGAVFEAEHQALQKHVALKLLRPSLPPGVAERFTTEAQSAAKLKHPGIVEVHDFGRDPNHGPFLTMDLLEGRSLAKAIAAGPLDIATAVRFALETLVALEVAHAAGVVHRDIKPENLFLVRDDSGVEHVLVLDFGLAKARGVTNNTVDGHILGTPQYMSREQLLEPTSVDPRADVYSLGATLFETLTGACVVEGTNLQAIIGKITSNTDMRRSPRALRPEVPLWLDAIVARSLSSERDGRFASAQEMRATLALGPGRADAVSVIEFDSMSGVALPDARFGRRRAWVAAVTAVVCVAALAFVALRERSEEEPLPLTDAGHRLDAAIDRPTVQDAPERPGDVPTPPPGAVYLPAATVEIGSSREEVERARARCLEVNPRNVGNTCDETVLAREEPRHAVRVPAFFLDVAEVTNESFVRWLGLLPEVHRVRGHGEEIDAFEDRRGKLAAIWTPRHELARYSGVAQDHNRPALREGQGQYPVVLVTWIAAEAFCVDRGGHLPTETQWERAARGTERRKYPWGASAPEATGTIFAPRAPTSPFAPTPRQPSDRTQDRTPEGVFDLAGNVSEWTASAFAPYAEADAASSDAATPTLRVIRGGSWYLTPSACRSAARGRFEETAAQADVGFRCAYPVPLPESR